MVERTPTLLSTLYQADETAWLEAMSMLIAAQRFEELDYEHLSEYLSDMAKRDRREVRSRLRTLLAHVLKWEFQPQMRTRSRRGTILNQRYKLRDLLDSKTLRNCAENLLAEVYEEARELAATETGLPAETFPAELKRSIDDVLTFMPEDTEAK